MFIIEQDSVLSNLKKIGEVEKKKSQIDNPLMSIIKNNMKNNTIKKFDEK